MATVNRGMSDLDALADEILSRLMPVIFKNEDGENLATREAWVIRNTLESVAHIVRGHWYTLDITKNRK